MKTVSRHEGEMILSRMNDKEFEEVAVRFVRAEMDLAEAKSQVLRYLNLDIDKSLLVEVNWTAIRKAGHAANYKI